VRGNYYNSCMEFNEGDELSEDKRLLRLGIDPDLPPIIIYLMLRERVNTLPALEDRLRAKHPQLVPIDSVAPSGDSASTVDGSQDEK